MQRGGEVLTPRYTACMPPRWNVFFRQSNAPVNCGGVRGWNRSRGWNRCRGVFHLRRLPRQRGLCLQYNFGRVERVADDNEGAAAHAAGDEALQAAVCVSFGWFGHWKRGG